MPTSFFVYGTLKFGHVNHGLLAPHLVSIVPARIGGNLYRTRFFPALREGPSEVRGELLTLNSASMERVLPHVDMLEEYWPGEPAQSLFLRRTVQAMTSSGKTVPAYAYYFNDACEFAQDVGPLAPIPGGEWQGPFAKDVSALELHRP